ncbi:MAG: hypothetical protein HZB29_12315 [Nitrospinae bacterium]|nr:hypothetical protein [Nitrospinota bacterium]
MDSKDQTLKKLQAAFEYLNQSTDRLTGAYEALKGETAGLKSDLEESAAFLKDILDSLNCAVVVAGPEGEVVTANGNAAKMEIASGTLVKEWLAKLSTAQGRGITWESPGGSVFTITASPLKSGAGGRKGSVLVIDDVTELERLKKFAKRGDRLLAIGEMAAGMAHEIRNPLGSMDIFASLLGRDLAGDAGKLKLVGHISSGIRSINNVISNFLLFTKEIRPVKREFDAKRLVMDVLEFAGCVLRDNRIDASAVLPEGAVPVTADPELIRQALLNLVHNAIQAMKNGGKLFVELRAATSGGKENFEIIVRDTGPGVPPAIREKIFDVFFTTKESGSGLGLSIASQIMQAHGGYIDLLDTPDGGAKFIMSAPVR